MKQVNIFFSENSDLSEYESINKGYRIDVFVEINNKVYNVHIYTLIRLQQDFETEFETEGFYLTEPNIVLVKNSNRAEIVNTINNLYVNNYFLNIKPVNDIDISTLIRIQ